MKKLEKLVSFQLENEKLVNVFGGQGGPAKPSLGLDPSVTGGGEVELPSGPGGACVCTGYTSDLDFHNGAMGYNGTYPINKPCN
ncbi:hypothetical protein SAMN05421664_0470 [Chryseobacterium soldanellicola]|uniref:Uncharacterized protein n=1 Tax=Chryseobacterium soldanellicola TaxID=311333 RepID=A0A1H0Y412_9FLAO|nr:hypothetical protein [Chryseobacterium soldanellicola]SDQ09888.1 hypothetical protein SAMN05421664_0470 [Chryseobacterium soldanellicola]